MQRSEYNASWGAPYLVNKSTIDCSIRIVTVILEYFEHILTIYDITIHYLWRGSAPVFSKLAPPAPSTATATYNMYFNGPMQPLLAVFSGIAMYTLCILHTYVYIHTYCRYYLTEKTSTLPQCSWFNHTVCYQLFLVFNKILGENYGIVITGNMHTCYHYYPTYVQYVHPCVMYIHRLKYHISVWVNLF